MLGSVDRGAGAEFVAAILFGLALALALGGVCLGLVGSLLGEQVVARVVADRADRKP